MTKTWQPIGRLHHSRAHFDALLFSGIASRFRKPGYWIWAPFSLRKSFHTGLSAPILLDEGGRTLMPVGSI
jgi:hypothetical protein